MSAEITQQLQREFKYVKTVSAEITQQLQREFKYVFTRSRCFDVTLSLQVKSDSKPCQMPLRFIAYALQRPFKEEWEWLQQQDIIILLGMDETAEWCNSFVLVPKLNGIVRLYLDPVRLNQALLRPVHREPTLNDISPNWIMQNIFFCYMWVLDITT